MFREYFTERVESIRPVLLEALRRLTIGKFLVLHGDRAPGLTLGEESHRDDASVAPTETHRFRCGGRSHFDARAVQPASTCALVRPRIEQHGDGNIERTGFCRFVGSIAALPARAE